MVVFSLCSCRRVLVVKAVDYYRRAAKLGHVGSCLVTCGGRHRSWCTGSGYLGLSYALVSVIWEYPMYWFRLSGNILYSGDVSNVNVCVVIPLLMSIL